MPGGYVVYRFGDFELDPRKGSLSRDGQPVQIGTRPFRLLVELVIRAPLPMSVAAIEQTVWPGQSIGPEALRNTIWRLRTALGSRNGPDYIEKGQDGYRLIPSVQTVDLVDGLPVVEAGVLSLSPYVTAVADLATLRRSTLADAIRRCERTAADAPRNAAAFADLCAAWTYEFESTRFAGYTNLEALANAIRAGQQAILIDPKYSDGHSKLAMPLYLSGRIRDAQDAALVAIELERDCWPHHLRLAFVSAGEARKKAAMKALELRFNLALAHWLRATVFIARGAFDHAIAVLQEGCLAQDNQPASDAAYAGIGIHLLMALVYTAQNRFAEALQEIELELASPHRDHIYSQEARSNALYLRGAILLLQRDHRGANAAFRAALQEAPGHLFAMAALGLELPVIDPTHPRVDDVRLAHVIARVRAGQHEAAVVAAEQLITESRMPNALWHLPVEPIIRAIHRRQVWGRLLDMVDSRAS